MKPLPVAPLTQEDWLVWLHARHGFHGLPWLTLIDAYEDSDRRDAELMLELASNAKAFGRFMWPQALHNLWWEETDGGRLEWK
jgi:hypothetical protein